jgi:GTP-binding protein HflX|tara:strand:- start:6609 stop:7808 length:1200 start_codon:yes stop_codon:yes gene_type:complete
MEQSGSHVTIDYREERAVLIGVIQSGMTEELSEEYLDELQFLALTAGVLSVKRFTQKLQIPHPRTYVGKGKIEEIKEFIDANDIEVAIFDDELSPSQLRNIERVFEIKVLDRNNLILDIFASRARTSHAKAQVELAQMQYMLPRLTRLWTHLDRQKGGVGMRGPGETEIETDRRVIQQKISLLKKQLISIDKQMAIQRGNRGQLVRVALVGYTNVGKSTIMNLLSKSDVFAENKLFATLDTTVRKVVIHNLPFLLTDTVGFIRKLPHQLVESFKSTLDEVREADLLVHILDISHDNFEEQYNVVKQTIAEIDDTEKPAILVFNKLDAYQPVEVEDEETGKMKTPSIEEMKKTWMAKMEEKNCVFISAQEKENIDEFKEILYEKVKEIFKVRYPYNDFLY